MSRNSLLTVAYTVKIPLMPPRTSVVPMPPLRPGHHVETRSWSIANVVKRTALLVACLHRTGVNPLHRPVMPSRRTSRPAALSKPRFANLSLPEPEAAWIIFVFTASPGVTTRMLSATPALSPLTMLIHAARGWPSVVPASASSLDRVVSNDRKRIPAFPALDVASAAQPA